MVPSSKVFFMYTWSYFVLFGSLSRLLFSRYKMVRNQSKSRAQTKTEIDTTIQGIRFLLAAVRLG